MEGAVTLKTIHGRIHGKTIELDEAIDLADGAKVEIVIRPVQPSQPWGKGLQRSAGALADSWSGEDDEILAELHQDRERTISREIPE